MNETRNGPEMAPLREYVEELKIRVTMYDKNDKIVRTEQLDYGKKDDRLWLGKLSAWAWTNDYVVETEKDKE